MSDPAFGPIGDEERLAWLTLARTDGLNAGLLDELLEHFGDARSVVGALPELPSRGRKRPQLPDRRDVEREAATIAKAGAKLLARGEAAYPPLLRQIGDAPAVLTVLGDQGQLLRPCVAIVGSRNASVHGQRFAADIAAGLGEAGLTVVSGMARGIDGKAHEASLTTGTVAVLAGGTDVIYPQQHRDLYRRITETGAVISERPWGAEPLAKMFPRRNRIIAGLSLGVVVIEAAKRSGTLITATRAVEQNREVFAVPGFPADPRSAGTNHLIKQGAVLTETVDDVLEVLQPILNAPPVGFAEAVSNRTSTIDKAQISALQDTADRAEDAIDTVADSAPEDTTAKLLEALTDTPTAVDDLIRVCNLSAQVVTVALVELELAGRITRYPGNRVSRA
ncbi:MAG: DNA-processing protein DprA [Pseudomonadota bacterium]